MVGEGRFNRVEERKMRITKSLTIAIVSVTLVLTTFGAVRGQTTTLFTVAPMGPGGHGSQLIFSAGPVVEAGGPAMGLVPGDDIDGFSETVSLLEFRLLFSVDPLSEGGSPEDPGPPPNVTSEAALAPGQVAGDIFSSTEFFTPAGIVIGPPSPGEFDNFKVLDQGDLGLPPGNGGSEDDVDGGGKALVNPGDGSVIVPSLYFTLEETSPSLATLPGSTPSGADIFFDPTPDFVTGIGGDESLFASAANLGLLSDDDIDSLIMFDNDLDGVFTDGDQILFSLTRGSPSFTDVTSSLFGRNAADVFTVSFNARRGVPEVPGVFTVETSLGLLAGAAPGDELNALLVPEPSSLALLAFGGVTLLVRRRRPS